MKLFVYGTLLIPAIQRSVFGRTISGSPAILEGYTKGVRQFSDGTYPDLSPDESSHVDGMILDITENELFRCDKYEGDEYARITVKLQNGEEVYVYKGK